MPQARPVGPAPTITASNTLELLLNSLVYAIEFRRESGNVFPAALCHIGPTAALSSSAQCDLLHQFPGLHFRRQIFCNAAHDRDLGVTGRRQYYHRRLPFVAERIDQRAKLGAI